MIHFSGQRLTQSLLDAVASLETLSAGRWEGRLSAASSRGLEVTGLSRYLNLGDHLTIISIKHISKAVGEVVAIFNDVVHVLLFTEIEGLGVGAIVVSPLHNLPFTLRVSAEWLGRIIDPLGHALDCLGPLPNGLERKRIQGASPGATRRGPLGDRMSVGVRALDLFTACHAGQRFGIFAGSGVGKSSLLGTIARNATCDVTIIGLIGERGREVREFVEETLGPATLERSVVVVATSDKSALLRRQAAYVAMSIAEYFKDCGCHVLLLMDSITRFCQALREIALAGGEAPASRGYPPTVFSELPRLLERAGPWILGNTESIRYITAFFTVLVEGDDLNEPISDSVRGLLDGHIILDRRIAERGRFPPVDVMRSLSRAKKSSKYHHSDKLAAEARYILNLYYEISELISIGVTRGGSNAESELALIAAPRIEDMLRQEGDESSNPKDTFDRLTSILDHSKSLIAN